LKNLLGIIYGIVYGASLIIPGLSGGTFLVIFGCYDKICAAFALDFKMIKKHFIFYVFFGIGAICGLVGFLVAIKFLQENFNTPTFLFFLGLILGGIPFILKVARTPYKADDSTAQDSPAEALRFKPMCILPFLLGLALVVGISLGTPPKFIEDEAREDLEPIGTMSEVQFADFRFGYAARIGLIAVAAAVAMVLPGISGAGILLAFGAYNEFTGALSVSNPDFNVLVPAGIGVLIGIVAGAKLIRWLLKKSKLMVYSAIIGMVIGSVVPVLREANVTVFNSDVMIGTVCMLVGIVIVTILTRKETV
jgi:putative membrane protein